MFTLAVQTAMTVGVPPTVFILVDKQPEDGWSKADKKLAIAWTILQRETCKICGQPLWICRSSNKNLMFSVRKDTCYADAEMKRWENKKNKPDLKPGEYPYVVAHMYEDEPLPNRLEYMRELNEE